MKSGWVTLLLVFLLPGVSGPRTSGSRPTCKKNKLFKVQHIVAWSTPSRRRNFFYLSGLAVDADGAFRAYHANDRLGLDSLAHAGRQGNWWALVTDNGKAGGRPVIQGKTDPAPGYFVSATALYDPGNPNTRDPHRYVDALTIPYVVLPPEALNHARLGDFATVVNFQNRKISAAIVADESASSLPVGEGSIALAEALGIDSSPRYGGKEGAVAYLIYPGSGNGRPRPQKEIVANSRRLFAAWGGLDRLNACLADD